MKDLTIGIAIPVHYDHLTYLYHLLEHLNKQTKLPDTVSISISSCPVDIDLDENKFEYPIIIHIFKEKKNAAQNRNIAASSLETDIISFIDADDIPHFQRNEIILNIFKSDLECTSIVHNYSDDISEMSNPITVPPIYWAKYIDTVYPDCLFPQNSKMHFNFHCAHVSILKNIFDILKYNEDWSYFRIGEDSLYLKTLVENGFLLGYIQNKLSWYRISNVKAGV
jgi:glycosyltransferase involved in cell wall biosynthesis